MQVGTTELLMVCALAAVCGLGLVLIGGLGLLVVRMTVMTRQAVQPPPAPQETMPTEPPAET